MTEDELKKQYLQFEFLFETMVASLLARNLLLEEMVPNTRKQFCDSLNEGSMRERKVLFRHQESICQYMRDTDRKGFFDGDCQAVLRWGTRACP